MADETKSSEAETKAEEPKVEKVETPDAAKAPHENLPAATPASKEPVAAAVSTTPVATAAAKPAAAAAVKPAAPPVKAAAAAAAAVAQEEHYEVVSEYRIGEGPPPLFLVIAFIFVVCWAMFSWIPFFGY
ncbi:MAG: hypothetical protein IAF58_21970 [Leptolyngbya sp.]|nr:hypothetical protein [Candidatus Melainabacteria bacterium]